MDPIQSKYLIERHFDASLTADEKVELEQLLLDSADARQMLWAAMQEHLLLRVAAQTAGAQAADALAVDDICVTIRGPKGGRSVASLPPPPARAARSGWRGLVRDYAREPAMLAVLIVSLVSAGVLAYSFSQYPMAGPTVASVPPAGEPKASVPAVSTSPVKEPVHPSAQVTRTADARWDESLAPKSDGMAKGQRLKLAGGLVEITFDSQATVLVEGPAELTIAGDNRCQLSAGKLVAKVPASAHGFTVDTPTLKIIDLGTEFGVEVKNKEPSPPASSLQPPVSSDTEVHVLTGRVTVAPLHPTDKSELQVAQQPPVELKAGEAVRSNADSPELKATPAKPGKFVREIPSPTPPTAAPVWPADSPLQPGDILVTCRPATLMKVDPKTGAQKLLAASDRAQYGQGWSGVEIEPTGTVLVGAERLSTGGSGVLRIDPRDGKITVLASGGVLTEEYVQDLALDRAGHLYAMLNGPGLNYVVKIDPASGKLLESIRLEAIDARGIHMDPNGRDAWMTYHHQFGTVGLLRGGKVTPIISGIRVGRVMGVAVRPDGRIFVSSEQEKTREILEVHRGDEPRVTTIATLPGGLTAPEIAYMAVETDGNLIAVGGAREKSSVYRINPDRGTIATLASGGSLDGPFGVAIVPQFKTQPTPKTSVEGRAP